MSWDSYIDNIIAGAGGNCDQACIISLDGGGLWTTAHGGKGISVSASEGATIAGCMKSGNFDVFNASGVHLSGIKYMFLRSQDKTVMAKKKEKGAITIQKTATAIIIAHCIEGGTHGLVNGAVSRIAEYLEQQNM